MEQRQKPRPPQPLGPLWNGTQKIGLTIFYVLGTILILSAIRNIGIMYRDWLIWVMLIILVFMMVVFFPLLREMYRKPKR